MMPLLPCMTICLLLGACAGQSRNDSIRLMDDMLRGYNRKHRPVLNQSDTLYVDVKLDVVSINDFDEVGGTFSIVVIMKMSWRDEVINWDPASYGGITSQTYDITDIWYPLLVPASSSEKFKDLAENWMAVRISYMGKVFFNPGLLIKSRCDVDVTYYPFDRQKCEVNFHPWINLNTEMRLNAPSPFADTTFYNENGEWMIIRNLTYVNAHGAFKLELDLERRSLFVVVNTILPIILMSVLNLMVFLLPPDSGERVSYTTTVLLAIAVFLTLVADSLPSTSKPMSMLAFFLSASLCISAAICVATIMNLRVYHRSDSVPLSTWHQRVARCFGCKSGNAIKTNKTDAEEKKSPQPSVVWYDVLGNWATVASAIDLLLLIGFGVIDVVNITVFMVVLDANK